jgi:hypothetical protein
MLIIIIVIISSFITGYLKPYKTAWIIIFLVPILGPSAMYIGVDSGLPMTAYRIGFIAMIGIYVRLNVSIMSIIKHNRYLHIIILYFIILFFLQIGDRYYNPTLFTLFPYYMIPIFIPFVVIHNKNDLYKLCNIFVLHAIIISFFIIVEHTTAFSLPAFIREISGLNLDSLQGKGGLSDSIRSGSYRAAGLHGNSVQTAYHLVFLIPFTIFYLKHTKVKYRQLPFFLSLIALFLLQTRAAIIVFFISMLAMVIINFINKNIYREKNNLIHTIILGSVGVLFFSLFDNSLLEFAEEVLSNSYSSLFDRSSAAKELDITNKLERIPVAISLFMENPLYGHLVSPRYAYYELMRTADVPLPFLQLIGGGVLFITVYILLLFNVINGLYTLIKRAADNKLKSLIILATIATISGFMVTLSNNATEHFMNIFLVFVSIKLYFARNKKEIQSISY